MHEHTCEFCDQPAMIHETAIESGGVVERHYCEAHGAVVRSAGVRADEPNVQAAFANLVAWYDGLSDAEKARLQTEYRRTRRLV
jgi:hypothetical protein